MLVMSKDHKLFLKAYDDVVDLIGNGVPTVTYTDSINYYGYFDSNKCYSYVSGNNRFEAQVLASGANNHYCSGYWSGNFLNWATMARIDVMRAVLYGGRRDIDENSATAGNNSGLTVLSRTTLSQDSHSWVKVYTGSDIAKLTPSSGSANQTAVTICNTNTSNTGSQANWSLMNFYWGNVANGPATPGNPYNSSDNPGSVNKGLQYYPYAAALDGGVQCTKQYNSGANAGPPLPSSSNTAQGYGGSYYVNVKVCDPTVSLESNCLLYGTTYKPTGVMQTLGLNPITNAPRMYFGLITGSYNNNQSGGVLRSNFTDMTKEINTADGTINTTSSNIIKTLDLLQLIYYDFTNQTWATSPANCGLSATFTQGTCQNWGNPMSEMYYEALRYFMGKSGPTSQFSASPVDPASVFNTNLYSSSATSLPVASSWVNPYSATGGNYPSCSKPFILMLSDVYASWDSDQLPGSYWPATISTNDTPSVQTLIENSTMNSLEGISSAFVGQYGATNTGNCFQEPSSGTGFDFSQARGLCAEEPTKQGSYYMAGLAWWAHTTGITNPSVSTNLPVNTYAVVTPSDIPNLSFSVGSNTVQIQPAFRVLYFSSSNLIGSKGQFVDFKILYMYNPHSSTPNISCPSGDTECATETTTNGYQYGYEVAYDDSGQGNDYDLDVRWRLFVKTNPSASTITIKTKGTFYSAGANDGAGYLINGVSNAGEYLELQGAQEGDNIEMTTFCNGSAACNGSNSPTCYGGGAGACGGTNSNAGPSSSPGVVYVERTFNVTGSSASFTHDPFWYAAKYGGFNNNNPGAPYPTLTSQWDTSGDGMPDNYFYAANPLQLQQQLQNAFSAILNQASSGTTVVSLPPSQTISSNILAQAYFFPEQQDNGVRVTWLGYLRTLWTDTVSNIRENTAGTDFMDIIQDKIVAFIYSATQQQFLATVYTDTNSSSGLNSCTSTTKELTAVTPIWEAGSILQNMNPASRTIYTCYNCISGGAANLTQFNWSNLNATSGAVNALGGYWTYTDIGACNSSCVQSVINYVTGYDLPTPSGSLFRLRQSDSSGSQITTSWKLGDIIFSTPQIDPGSKINGYDTRYGDTSYGAFITNTIKNNPPMVFVGANDGMMHAFMLGTLSSINPPIGNGTTSLETAELSPSSGTTLGSEAWAYIPWNAIPFLRWYCQTNYCHIPMSDATITLVDASIGGANTATKPSNGSSWKRLLVGSMGFGGTPITVGSANTTFSSSIFVMDITNPLSPSLLWEKQMPDHTLTEGIPGIVRLGAATVNGDWYLVTGSGATAITTASLTYPANPKLYVFNLLTGAELTGGLAITSTEGASNSAAANVAVGDFQAADLDYPVGDYQTDDVYFGTYSETAGGLYRLRIRNGSGSSYHTSPSQWLISEAVNAGHPVFASPALAIDPAANQWLYFGTGLYVTASDTSVTNELLYGFKESAACWQSGGAGCTYTNYIDMTNAAFNGAVAETYSCQCTGGATVLTGSCDGLGNCPNAASPGCPSNDGSLVVTSVAGATLSGSGTACDGAKDIAAANCLVNALNSFTGWKQTITGAKIYASPLVYGGIVSATEFAPSGNVCSAGGTSSLISLQYNTGAPYIQPTILSVAGTSGPTTNVSINKTVQISPGAPPFKQSLVPVQTGNTYEVFTQAAGGIASLSINPSISVSNLYILWMTK